MVREQNNNSSPPPLLNFFESCVAARESLRVVVGGKEAADDEADRRRSVAAPINKQVLGASLVPGCRSPWKRVRVRRMYLCRTYVWRLVACV